MEKSEYQDDAKNGSDSRSEASNGSGKSNKKGAGNDFVAKKSSRSLKKSVSANGDVWCEHLAVIEMPAAWTGSGGDT